MANGKKFNVRVYGLLIWENQVLVSDEFLSGVALTKFPGGGLEWGEGTAACLQREFNEELGLEVFNPELFYLNDFLQISSYNSDHQVLSIYYKVSCARYESIPVSSRPFDFAERVQGAQACRWVPIPGLDEAAFYFPIDKVVAGMLRDSK